MTTKLLCLVIGTFFLLGCGKPTYNDGNTMVNSGGNGYKNSEAGELAQEANQLLEERKTADARELLLESLKLEDNPYTYNSLGVADLLDSNYTSAIAYCEKAVAMDSTYWDAKLNLARTYYESKQTEKAIALNLGVIAQCDDSYKVGAAHLAVARCYGTIWECKQAMSHNAEAKQLLAGEATARAQLDANDQWLTQRCNSQEAKLQELLKVLPENARGNTTIVRVPQ